MLSYTCDEDNGWTCSECLVCCDSCECVTCMEWVVECVMCNAVVCEHCTYEAVTCACCQVNLHEDAAFVCMDCHIDAESRGYMCETCDRFCSNSNVCRVAQILEAQDTCPICLEPFDTYELQACKIHKVCTACDKNVREQSFGCPMCREGCSCE